jgi:hypothetical protein
LENPTNEEHRKPSLHIMPQLQQFGARILTETEAYSCDMPALHQKARPMIEWHLFM